MQIKEKNIPLNYFLLLNIIPTKIATTKIMSAT